MLKLFILGDDDNKLSQTRAASNQRGVFGQTYWFVSTIPSLIA